MQKLAIALLAGIAIAGCGSNSSTTATTDQDRTAPTTGVEDTTADATNDDPQALVNAATAALDRLTQPGDNAIPDPVLDRANCVAVIPNLTKAALGIGGRWGQGVASCRTKSGWSAPAFFDIAGGSIGPQIGVEQTNLIMMVMNKGGMSSLLNGKFELGGQASVAAGPVGAQAAAKGGWKAAVLTYSTQGAGAFAGASLEGATIQVDDDMMRKAYGASRSSEEVLSGRTTPPELASGFLDQLRKADRG